MKNYFLFYLLTFSLLFITTNSSAQKTRKTARFHMGIEGHIGPTFPNYITAKEKWKPTVYVAWGAALSVLMRFNKNWSGDISVGIENYTMVNRMPNDRYNLGFFSPTLMAGLQTATPISKKAEIFYGNSLGIQIGYNDLQVEDFEEYSVITSSDDAYYYFVRPQLGIRKEIGKKRKKYPMSYELGTYFRYNFNGLGSAAFVHDDYVEILKPKGHSAGIFFKILFPSSTTKIKLDTKEIKLPKAIFNPRF